MYVVGGWWVHVVAQELGNELTQWWRLFVGPVQVRTEVPDSQHLLARILRET